MVTTIRGSSDGSALVIGIVQARFNPRVTGGLLESAISGLRECGLPDASIHVLTVPGAVEIPLAARRLAESGRVDAVVAIGAVIRGETGHYDHVCHMVSDGCMRTALELDVPIAFGVLTTENGDQARARIDRGRDAALSAVEMANLLRGQEA